MRKIVFFLEEQSAKAFLESFLPRILPEGFIFHCIAHEGKNDLEKSIPRKLRAWREKDVIFVILRDQDSADCRNVKNQLVGLCQEAGRSDVLVRISCRELESWYLADLAAVENALGEKGVAQYQERRKFRNPDALSSPSAEMIQIVPSYQKISSSRQIGLCIDPKNIRSKSFYNFVQGLRRICHRPHI